MALNCIRGKSCFGENACATSEHIGGSIKAQLERDLDTGDENDVQLSFDDEEFYLSWAHGGSIGWYQLHYHHGNRNTDTFQWEEGECKL